MKYSNEYKYLYKTSRWRLMSIEQRTRQPTCVMCGANAEVADHIRPHKGDEALFFDPRNLQSLCKRCHDSHKAMMERGKKAGKDFVPNNEANDDGLPRSKQHPWNH